MRLTFRYFPLVAAFGIGISYGSTNTAIAGDTADCSRLGTARIRIADQLFIVPRNILGQVELSTGKTDQSWRCSDQIIDARNFFINVTPTYAGTEFYRNWTYQRRLPHTIEIAERGKFKNFNVDRLAAIVTKDAPAIAEEDEFRIVETKSQIFYASKLALRDFHGQMIVFVCSKPRTEVKRTCHTNYHLSDRIDLRYEFRDPPIGKIDWVALDQRTRQVVGDLSSKANR